MFQWLTLLWMNCINIFILRQVVLDIRKNREHFMMINELGCYDIWRSSVSKTVLMSIKCVLLWCLYSSRINFSILFLISKELFSRDKFVWKALSSTSIHILCTRQEDVIIMILEKLNQYFLSSVLFCSWKLSKRLIYLAFGPDQYLITIILFEGFVLEQ